MGILDWLLGTKSKHSEVKMAAKNLNITRFLDGAMQRTILIIGLVLLLIVSSGCPTPTPTEKEGRQADPDPHIEEVTVVKEERQEDPDPYIVQRGNLVASYKYSGGVLTGAEVFTGVENRGGAGSVKVVFMGRERGTVVWTDSKIIYLESGESKKVSGFVPASVIRPPGLTTARRIEITATASPIQLDIDSLIRDLDHENPTVCKNTAIMLGAVRGKRVVEPLIKALQDEDSSVRGNAAKALGEIGDARAVEPLIQALKDESRFVRREASEALIKIGDARAVESVVLANSRFFSKNPGHTCGSLANSSLVTGTSSNCQSGFMGK
ncbi:HEAT repeat domain-containing protein [Dehalococcoidia bacterium]|nr:HEAT repeat domain-containing protein [Dehalococcoidia bacterium]